MVLCVSKNGILLLLIQFLKYLFQTHIKVAATSVKPEIRLPAQLVGTNTRSGTEVTLSHLIGSSFGTRLICM